jgi:hypothetical protein
VNGQRRTLLAGVVGVALVVVAGVGGHEAGLRGAGAFALPLAVGVVVGAAILGGAVGGEE